MFRFIACVDSAVGMQCVSHAVELAVANGIKKTGVPCYIAKMQVCSTWAITSLSPKKLVSISIPQWMAEEKFSEWDENSDGVISGTETWRF